MSRQAEAELILKLYDLRREETMRKARDWYFREFNPQSMADFQKVLFSEHSGHVRQVMSYWEMAAALVNHGAISMELFNDTNGEHIGVFAAVELLLPEVRAMFGPQFMASLEKLIDATPGWPGEGCPDAGAFQGDSGHIGRAARASGELAVRRAWRAASPPGQATQNDGLSYARLSDTEPGHCKIILRT